ncbi:MAG TPA: alpha/beta hydrolase [Capillimicrobium sp.]|nr:alpha/beta hydrolase [Capillimicrobium sp.]
MMLTLDAVRVPGGVRLPLARQGGPGAVPVLMLHGWGDSWRSFEPVLPALPGDVEAIALTQRGHGDADRPVGSYGIDQLADDAAAALEELGVRHALVVGHSLGAWVAQQLAADRPELVGGLLLAGSIGPPAGNPALAQLSAEIARLGDPVDPAFARGFQLATTASPIDPAWVEVLVAETLKLPVRVWRAIDAGLRAFDLDAVQPRVAAPVLLVWGERDAFTGRGEQERHLRGLPHARLLTYEGTGHAVHRERPERFAADVAALAASLRAAGRL